MKQVAIAASLVAVLAVGTLAQGAVTVTPDVENGGWWKLGTSGAATRSATQDSNVGQNSGTPYSAATTYLLPDLGGLDVDSVDLEMEHRAEHLSDDNEPPTATAALFVKIQAADEGGGITLAEGDYLAPMDYTGGIGMWTMIQDDYFTEGIGNETAVSLSAAGASALKTFLQGYYDGTPSGGDYLVANFALDLNDDTLAADGHDKYNINISPGGSGDSIYSMTIETIPEPATMSLLGLGGLVALRRRRRA